MSIKHLLKLKPVRQFAIFCGLFELGMLLSITTMPLYFRQENAVAAYSMAYAVMAITGVFSFIYGLVVDRLGASNSLLIGILLYGLALSARVFTSPIIAILVAILAGMGASISLIALRSWTFAITKIKEGATVQITSLRSILGYSANLIAMGIIAISVQLWGSSVYFILMLVASGLILTTLFTTINKIPLQKPKSTEKSFKKLDITWTKTAKLLVNSSFIDGLCKGLFVPFIILMLVDLGLTENKAVWSLSLATTLSLLTNTIILRYQKTLENKPINALIIILIALISIYLGIAFSIEKGALIIVLILTMLRGMVKSALVNIEEVIHYRYINPEAMGRVLGSIQTSDLAGSAIGSLLTGQFLHKNYSVILIICAGLFALKMILFYQLKNTTTN